MLEHGPGHQWSKDGKMLRQRLADEHEHNSPTHIAERIAAAILDTPHADIAARVSAMEDEPRNEMLDQLVDAMGRLKQRQDLIMAALGRLATDPEPEPKPRKTKRPVRTTATGRVQSAGGSA